MCVCVWEREQFGAVVKALGSQSKGCEFKSHQCLSLSLSVVTLGKSLYPHCFSQLICKTDTWPCAGVDMTIDCGNMAVACVE